MTVLELWRRFLAFCIPFKFKEDRDTNTARSHDRTTLRRALPGWQIFMIAIGGVIGVTIFSTHGMIIRLAGPGGLLIATIFVALTMICVMECIGQLVIIWPISNAMVEYVRAFVDEDLAIVVGIAYWYAQSCVFATMIIFAANFARYTIESEAGRDILFYAIVPICIVLINILGVEYYGFVEGVGGLAKLLMVLSGIFFMIVKAPQVHTENLDAGFQFQDSYAGSRFEAICIAIPLVAYGYISTEVVSVTAFEAIDRKSLRFPVKWVSYIIATLYFLCALLQSFLVNYTDKALPSIDGTDVVPLENRVKRATSSKPDFSAVIVIAAYRFSSSAAGRYFNGCITYFCISAANTALYVASRTLFGLTRQISKDESTPILLRPLRHFGTTTPTRQVPLFSLIFSAVSFYWLVPLQVARAVGITDLLNILGTTASVGVIIVWASQCIAYIRYYNWLRRFRDSPHVELPPEYNRWEPQPELYSWHADRTVLANFKLVPAVVGLIGCFCIVFIFSTANWWKDGNVNGTKLATAYAGPIVLLGIFILLKLWNRRWWVVLPVTNEKFAKVTGNLERNSNLRDIPNTLPQVVEVRDEAELEVPSAAMVKESSVEVAPKH